MAELGGFHAEVLGSSSSGRHLSYHLLRQRSAASIHFHHPDHDRAAGSVRRDRNVFFRTDDRKPASGLLDGRTAGSAVQSFASADGGPVHSLGA